jgi:hypothetical protein
MSSYNVVMFGEPDVSRKAIIDLAIEQDIKDDYVLQDVFDSRRHTTQISESRYHFYDTAGLYDNHRLLGAAESMPDPETALKNLYQLVFNMTGGVNLLIYVVRATPTTGNYKLFYEFLCQRKVPIILIVTDPIATLPGKADQMVFQSMHQLHLIRPIHSHHVENLPSPLRTKDSGKKKENALRTAICKLAQTPGWKLQPLDWFTSTAMLSWNLLERSAGWSIVTSEDALRITLKDKAGFSARDVEREMEMVKDYMKK